MRKDSIYEAMNQANTTGYVVIDSNKKFISCNHIGKRCIPRLSKCRVDTSIESEKELKFLCDWIDNFDIGVSTQKIDEISTTYSVDDLSRYKSILDVYKNNNGLGGKKLRTL